LRGCFLLGLVIGGEKLVFDLCPDIHRNTVIESQVAQYGILAQPSEQCIKTIIAILPAASYAVMILHTRQQRHAYLGENKSQSSSWMVTTTRYFIDLWDVNSFGLSLPSRPPPLRERPHSLFARSLQHYERGMATEHVDDAFAVLFEPQIVTFCEPFVRRFHPTLDFPVPCEQPKFSL
jgi:hypothetical protein